MKDKILEMVRQSAAREQPYGWLNYQPVNLPGYEETIPLRGRDCFDRSEAVFAHLRRNFGAAPQSLVDWGCNLGFFVFEAAKLGHVARGFDSDRRLVAACEFLASSTRFPSAPFFHAGTMSADVVRASAPVDVILCLSVLHHLPEKERFRTIEAIANRCRGAYIEMDGSDYGRRALQLFFWRVEPVTETSDRYGTGRRRRKTWFCTNRDGDRTLRNLKDRNFVFDRGIFLCSRDSGSPTVLKRERTAPGCYSHTWLKTSLVHERKIYEEHRSEFFPALLAAGEEDFRWIELEYLESRGVLGSPAVDALFGFLEESRLFVIDFRIDSFISCDGRLRMIDLESVFTIEGSIQETILRNAQDPKRIPPHLTGYDTYEKQKAALKRALLKRVSTAR